MKFNEVTSMLLEVMPIATRELRSMFYESHPSDLTLAQYRILGLLGCGEANTKEIAESLGVSLPAISRTMKTLVNSDLVARAQNASDKREVVLKLTPKGVQLLQRSTRSMRSKLNENMNRLSKSQQKCLGEGLIELRGFLQGLRE